MPWPWFLRADRFADFRRRALHPRSLLVVRGVEALLEPEQLGDTIALEDARPPGILIALPDEPERVQFPEASPRKLPEPAQDRPLAEARDVIRRILSAEGTIHGDEDDPDFVPRQLLGIADAAERECFLFRGDYAVFDMRPANVFMTDEGDVVPVDCIPVKLPAGKHEFFAK